MIEGFEPVYDSKSKVLILGSFPSVKSREISFYYGNKRNRFWNVLRKFYNENFGEEKEDKIRFLLKNKIALWDVAAECEIKGSSDSDIKKYVVADIRKILDFSEISYIILNGGKCAEIFRKNFDIKIKTYALPSTSPANVSFDENKWFDALTEIKNAGF